MIKIPITFTAVLRKETAGRKGKTVTVIDKLPKHETFLEELSRYLKTKCGTGGTYTLNASGGMIEIQGDQRERIRELLREQGIPCKG